LITEASFIEKVLESNVIRGMYRANISSRFHI